jgi:GDP-fucose transporter C1
LNKFYSNKAVLNNAPELPLLFLLIQLIIAVILLHVSALLFKRVEIPVFEKETAKNLTPVVLVNIIGLVFNTLCLRDVETTFFQVREHLPFFVFKAN